MCTPNRPWLRARCAQTKRALRPSRALGTVSRRTPGRVMAPSQSCRRHVLSCRCAHERAGAQCRIVWACCVAASLPAIQKLYRDTKPLALCACCRECRSSLHRIVARYCALSQPCCAVSRSKGRPLSHDTNFCIATLR